MKAVKLSSAFAGDLVLLADSSTSFQHTANSFAAASDIAKLKVALPKNIYPHGQNKYIVQNVILKIQFFKQ